MGVPKHRKNHSRVRTKRSHHALKPIKAKVCPQCKAPMRSHQACPICGYYNGRQVIRSKEDLKLKRDTKRKKQEQKHKEKMAKMKNK